MEGLTPYKIALAATITSISKDHITDVVLEENLLCFACDHLYPRCPVKSPPSLEAYVDQVRQLEPKDEAQKYATKLKDKMYFLTNNIPDHYYKFINEELKTAVVVYSPTDATAIHPEANGRRSPFGLFIRRCLLLHARLDWTGSVLLVNDLKNWVEGNRATASTSSPICEDLNRPIVPTWTKTWDEDDYSRSLLRLRNAHDFPTIPPIPVPRTVDPKRRRRDEEKKKLRNMETGHEWFLISLASFYLRTQGWLAAKLTLDEAFKVCKKVENSEAMARCQSLFKRLPSNMNSDEKKMQEEIDISPLPKTGVIAAELNDASLLKQEAHVIDQMKLCADAILKGGHHMFSLIFPCLQLKELALWITPGYATVDHESSYQALVSEIWRKSRQTTLSIIHERLAMDGRDECSVTATYAKSVRLTREGLYDEATTVLLNLLPPKNDTRRSLFSIREFSRWSRAMWSVEWTKADRRGDTRLLEYIKVNIPPIAVPPCRWISLSMPEQNSLTWDLNVEMEIEKWLRQGASYIKHGQYASAIHPLYEALELADRFGLEHSSLLAKIFLWDAEGRLGDGMEKRSIDLISTTATILAGAEKETQAYAFQLIGSCIARLADKSGDESLHLKAAKFLEEAVKEYHTLSPHHVSIMECRKKAAHAYNSEGSLVSLKLRNELAKQCLEDKKRILDMERGRDKFSNAEFERLLHLNALMVKIGAKIAVGRMERNTDDRYKN